MLIRLLAILLILSCPLVRSTHADLALERANTNVYSMNNGITISIQLILSLATFVFLLFPPAAAIVTDVAELFVSSWTIYLEWNHIRTQNPIASYYSSSKSIKVLYILSRFLFIALPVVIFAVLLIPQESTWASLLLCASNVFVLCSFGLTFLCHFYNDFKIHRREFVKAFEDTTGENVSFLKNRYMKNDEFCSLLQKAVNLDTEMVSQVLCWTIFQEIEPSEHLRAINAALKVSQGERRTILIRHLLSHFGWIRERDDMLLVRRYPLVARIIEAQHVFLSLSMFYEDYLFLPELRSYLVQQLLISSHIE